MKTFQSYVVAFALVANFFSARAQDTATLTAAVATVTPEPAATLFDYEYLQLVDDELNQLDSETRSMFDFADPGTATEVAKRTFTSCKAFPGDDWYPRELIWNIFDILLGRTLVKSVPAASVCYDGPNYDKAQCEYVAANFNNSYFVTANPVEVLSPIYQGMTCMPTDNPTDSCTLGGYPSYAVNVSNVAQIQLAINFARNVNLRLVVKNTGHDFSGKSSGAGSLSIWTHNLKKTQFIPKYAGRASGWSGAAIKAGAGMQAYDLYEFASKHGIVVVGGEGQTVGVMGGYIIGGGHSPLSSVFGMAADQVLEMEVVLPSGRFVTASFSQNQELFWALRGGGGSTFGVVTSVTVKAHPDMQVTASKFTFASGGGVSLNSFWQGVRYYFDYFPDHADAGVYSYFFIFPASGEDRIFIMQPFFAPGKSLEEGEALLAPWLSQLASLNISVTPQTTNYPSFYDAWKAEFPLEVLDKTHGADSSRLFPRRNWANTEILDKTFAAWKSASDEGISLIGFNLGPTLERCGNPDNAVNPAWRDTLMHSIAGMTWPVGSTVEEIIAARDAFTNGTMARWRDVTPGSGAYLGESDRLEPNFQESFYGDPYPRLLALKKTIDPFDTFWAATAVGSEGWHVVTEDGLPNENGRLCRV